MLTRLGPVHKPQHRIWSSSVTCCFSLSLHFLSSLWTGSQKYRTSMAKVAPSVPSPISRLAPPTIVLQDMEEESDEDRWVIWVPEEVLRFFMRSNRSLKRLTSYVKQYGPLKKSWGPLKALGVHGDILLILKDPDLLTVVWCILEEVQEGLKAPWRSFMCPSACLIGPWMLKDPVVLEKFNASLERFKGGPRRVNKDVYEVLGQFYEFSFFLNKLCGSLRRFCGYWWIQGSQQEFDAPLKGFQSCFIRLYRSFRKFMGQGYVRISSRGPQRSRDLWGSLIHLSNVLLALYSFTGQCGSLKSSWGNSVDSWGPIILVLEKVQGVSKESEI